MSAASLSLYGLAGRLLSPLARPMLEVRVRAGKEDPLRLGERLGRPGAARPPGPLAWLHGASVGEGLSLLPLARGLVSAAPGCGVLVTTGTVTSAALLAGRLPERALHQYAPLDLPTAAERFIAAWRPDVAVFVESEIWPNLLQAARRTRARTALLSARLSSASVRGWSRAPGAARTLFSAFDLVMAQTDATARDLEGFGARDDGRLNLKRAAEALPLDEAVLQRIRRVAAGRPILLAASTHPGEEDLVLRAADAAGGNGLLVIAPRHPRRGDEVEALIRAGGRSVTRQSRGEAFGGARVHLADTLGELGQWYAAATIAFVGGSLAEGPGGHNPLEPARLDCPVVSGPHTLNWSAVYADLDAVGGIVRVADGDALAATFAAVVRDPQPFKARAARAAGVAAEDAAGLTEALTRLSAWLR